VVGGVGTYFIVKAHDDQRDADNASAAFQKSQQPGGKCYLMPGTGIPQSCQGDSDHVTDLNNSAKLKKWIGWGVAGAGAAALVTGAIFLLVTDSIDDVKIAGVQLHPHCLGFAQWRRHGPRPAILTQKKRPGAIGFAPGR
jgi:hypothetical protein